MFDHLVNLTEPICQKRNPDLAGMTIFDTSGIETWVTENNPKYANRIIKQLKVFKKSHIRHCRTCVAQIIRVEQSASLFYLKTRKY